MKFSKCEHEETETFACGELPNITSQTVTCNTRTINPGVSSGHGTPVPGKSSARQLTSRKGILVEGEGFLTQNWANKAETSTYSPPNLRVTRILSGIKVVVMAVIEDHPTPSGGVDHGSPSNQLMLKISLFLCSWISFLSGLRITPLRRFSKWWEESRTSLYQEMQENLKGKPSISSGTLIARMLQRLFETLMVS